MQSLPNELTQQILFHLTPSEILKANLYETISQACDWNFWKEKTVQDFGVSRQYFDLPLQFPEGVGSFNELNPNSDLNRGVYRYVQIANRFFLLVESFVGEDSVRKDKGPYEMIQSHVFFERAYLSNQFEHIDFLLDNISILILTSYLSYEIHIDKIIGGKRVPNFYSDNRQTFESRIIESIFSPCVLKSFENYQFSYLPFQLQIEQGHFSSELKDFINRPVSNYVIASEVLSIVRDLLIREHLFDLSGAIGNIINYSISDGFQLFLSAIKGDDRGAITQILDNSIYSEYLNTRKDDVMNALSFNGDFDLFQFAKQRANYSNDEGFINAYSLALGYRHFRKPERYLDLLNKIRKIKNLSQDLAYLIKLADCDILSFLYRCPQITEMYPQKSQFLLFAFALVLGSLDCVAWIIRALKTLNLSEEENRSLLKKFQSQQRDPCSTANSSVYRKKCSKSWNLLYMNYFGADGRD